MPFYGPVYSPFCNQLSNQFSQGTGTVYFQATTVSAGTYTSAATCTSYPQTTCATQTTPWIYCTNQIYASVPYPRTYDRLAAQRRTVAAHPKKAQDRARALLFSHLSDEQRTTFEKNNWFVVEGGKNRRRYRIREAGALIANIDVMDGERVAHRLCGHADILKFPLGDHLLAQKLMLESAEDEFLKLANRHAA